MRSATLLFNTRDNEGKTPAHHAAENGHADSLRIVHNGGGNLSAQDDAGCTPAHYSAMNGHEGCLITLCDLGADIRSVVALCEVYLFILIQCATGQKIILVSAH
jgi:ankyrin repeat protein